MSEDSASYDVATVLEHVYSDQEQPDVWQDENMQEVADECWACDPDGREGDSESPSAGETVTVWRGDITPIDHSELLPDLAEYISERLYECAGEAAECTEFDPDLQSQFTAWASENITLNTFRVTNVQQIELVFDGTQWVDRS